MGINTSSNQLKKAVFLDRDGTLIRHIDLMRRVEDIKFFPDSDSAVKSLSELGFLNVVISNQPVVARGLIDEKGVEEIHRVMLEKLAERGAVIEAAYFCPHHPEATDENYRLKCDCRKPEPGMILKAAKEHNIDLGQSYIIGDSMIDVAAGKAAGLKTVLIKTGPGHAMDKDLSDLKPNFIAGNLSEAVEYIKKYS